MKYGHLIIEKNEYLVLKELLHAVDSKDPVKKACYDMLRTEIAAAEVRPHDDMPDEVVRLNSYIDVQTPIGLVEGYQLVLPGDADARNKKLSILTPMGSALIGYSAGDDVLWNFPAGEIKIQIQKVYREFDNVRVSA